MGSYFRRYGLAVLIAFAIQTISEQLSSPFVINFLSGNLITLLLALLAINTTTISVIMTKLREISTASGVSFGTSIAAMRHSIIEQVVLLGAAVVVLVLKESAIVVSRAPWTDFLFSVLLITIMVGAVQVLYDTANGVFVIALKEDEVETRNSKSTTSEPSASSIKRSDGQSDE